MIEIVIFLVNGVSLYILSLYGSESTTFITVPYQNRTVHYLHGIDFSGMLRYGTVLYSTSPVGLFRVIKTVKVLYFMVRYDTGTARYGTGTVTYGTFSYIQILGIEKKL